MSSLFNPGLWVYFAFCNLGLWGTYLGNIEMNDNEKAMQEEFLFFMANPALILW